jgi:hypothetical protein
VKIKILLLFIFQILCTVAKFTNPDIDVHKEFARGEFLKEYNKPGEYIRELVDIVVEEKVYSDSYFFFSLTKFDDLGTLKTIGVGVFGQIIPYYCIQEHKYEIIFALIAILLTIKLILDFVSPPIKK